MDYIFNATYGEYSVLVLLIYKVLPTGFHDIDKKRTLSQVHNVYWWLYFSTDRIILELCCMLENGYV